MKTRAGLAKTFFAIATAAGVVACGADDKDKDKESDKSDGKPIVEVKTSMGSFKIEINQKDSPITGKNFIKYVEKKHYDNTIFHRVISNFMIQGGGFEKGDTPLEKETMEPIRNESKTNGLHNEKYTIAMARTGDPHSATSQFFINVADNRRSLDAGDGYTVFGKVIEGTEVVEKIKAVPTATKQLKSRHAGRIIPGGHKDVPVEPVIIESMRVVTKKKVEEKKEPAPAK